MAEQFENGESNASIREKLNTNADEINSLATSVASKADSSALAAKADTSVVNAALANKADVSALTSGLAGKASTTDLANGLAAKANTTDMTTALALKANTSTVNSALALKADSTALATKADSSALTAGLAGKADTSALAAKADTTALTAGLATKADITALDLKADKISGLVPLNQLPPVYFQGVTGSGTIDDPFIVGGSSTPAFDEIPGYSDTEDRVLYLQGGVALWGPVPDGSAATLSTPTLTAGTASVNAIALTWTSVIDATVYELIQSLNSGLTSPTVIYSGSGLAFTPTGLNANTHYYFGVRAKAGGFIASSFGTADKSTLEAGNIVPPPPTAMIVNDTANTANWTNATGFPTLSDYEYQINSGTITTVTVKPFVVGDVYAAVGDVKIRVKAATGRDASAWLTNTTEFTGTPITPAAPTGGVVDNDADTFAFTLNSTYPSLSDYEYQVNSGAIGPVTSNPIGIGDISVPIGQLKVRVKAATGRTVSSWLTNATAFTVLPEVTVAITDWPTLDKFTQSTNTLTSTTGTGVFGYALSSAKLAAGTAGFVEATITMGAILPAIGFGQGLTAKLTEAQMDFSFIFNNINNRIQAKNLGTTSVPDYVTITPNSTTKIRLRGDGTTMFCEYSLDDGATYSSYTSWPQPNVDLYVKIFGNSGSSGRVVKNVRGKGLV